MHDFVSKEIVLALDTALSGCGVAVARSGAVLASVREAMARGQTERLVPLVQSCLQTAGVAFSEIGMIAVTVGPGTFTGLRIGLATARGFGLALGVPVVGVTTFEVLARQARAALETPLPLLVVVETRRQDIAVQVYDAAGQEAGDPECLMSADLLARYGDRRMVLAGDALERLQGEIGAERWPSDWVALEGQSQPDPAVMCALAVEQAASGAGRAPEPLYLRGADVSFPDGRRAVVE